MIPSLWLPIIKFGVEILTHKGDISAAVAEYGAKTAVGKLLDSAFQRKGFSPKPLIDLRYHFYELQSATDTLILESEKCVLSASYNIARTQWVDLFAPAVAALHSVDPKALSTIGIYSPSLAELLSRDLVITSSTLAQSLQSEEAEIVVNDANAHLCTLCLYTVRIWSNEPTTVEALRALGSALGDTIRGIDDFIKANWSPQEI